MHGGVLVKTLFGLPRATFLVCPRMGEGECQLHPAFSFPSKGPSPVTGAAPTRPHMNLIPSQYRHSGG